MPQHADISVLIVDDDETNRDLLNRRLLREGYHVACAESGRRALDMLRIERYDLVLLDIMMPGTDGYDVLRQIKKDTLLHDTPVIMLTAVHDHETAALCRKLGAFDYVEKPFEITQLKSRIWQCLLRTRGPTPHLADNLAHHCQVLIVDDDEVNRDILSRRLHKYGHIPYQAASGAQAMALLQQRHFDLVLLDISMAQLDGLQVLGMIRAHAKLTDIPVIMISALSDSATMQQAMELGADDYLIKPYAASVLRQRIQSVLADIPHREEAVYKTNLDGLRR